MSLKNFVVKNGLSVGNASITASSGNLLTGNANLGNLAVANFFSGAGNNLSNIQGANVSGQVGNALVAGTVYTNAQPNITSTGTLTGLTVNGVSNLGANGNVIITGGSSGQFLQTNGSGNLSWVTVGTSGISNGTSSVSVPVSNGNILANVNGSTVLTVASSGANITGYANVTGNANVGNLGTAGLITATGNVSGGNLTTGGALSVTGNANVGNIGGTAGVFTANVSAGNLTTGGVLSVTGNANVGNIGAAAGVFTGTLNVTGNANVGNIGAGAVVATTLGGTLTTASQPNITSVGTLSSLAVTANVAAGNLTTTGILSVTGTGTSSIAGNLDMTSNNIINLATPVNSTDAATKQYVDDVAQGLHTHDACQAATPDTLANISSGTVTYNNGTSGVGATLTTTGSYTTIDGVSLTNGMRILVKNEANTAHNGIYDRTSSTVLTRSTDFDTPTEMAGGDFTFVQAGTLYDNTGWVMPDAVTTVGTSPVVWVQFSGAGTYTAGTGLTLTGSQFSITNTAVTAGSYGNGDRVASFTVNSQGQLTAASNVAITANAANLTGTTLNSSIVNSSLTSVGTLTSLTVTGNASAGNISTGGVLSVTGNANVGNLGTGGLITATGNVTGGNLTTAGALSVTGNANIGNIGTAGLITATGNITGGNLTTAGALSVTGNANVGNIGAAAGVFTGTLNVTGNANVGNLGTAGLVVATGNVTGGNLVTSGALSVTGNANIGNIGTAGILSVTGNANVGNLGTGGLIVATGNITGGNLTTAGALSVTGNANVGNIGGNNAVFTLVTGTLTTAAQPNVTSLGTLTGLGVNGTITGVNITANTGVFTGNGSGLTAVAGGNVTGQVANALIAGTVYTAAQPNITSVGTLTSLAVTGNVTAGNVTGANLLSANYVTGTLTTAAQPNITSVGTLTSLTTSGNIVTSGNIKVGATGVGITSNRANVSVTSSATVIDQFAPSNWRTAKYVISASGADGYQSVEALVVHDGTDAYITIYGSVCSNTSADIIDLSANVNGVSGNVAIYAVSNSASCVVNLVSSYIKT